MDSDQSFFIDLLKMYDVLQCTESVKACHVNQLVTLFDIHF